VDKQKETWIKSNRSQFDELIQRAKAGAVKDKHIHQAPAISLAQDAPPEHHHDASAPTS
jgi:E3 ubiquitin-protein ligase RAD18